MPNTISIIIIRQRKDYALQSACFTMILTQWVNWLIKMENKLNFLTPYSRISWAARELFAIYNVEEA